MVHEIVITTILEATEQDTTQKGFYPTPEDLAQKMVAGIDWYKVNSVLEPSAGKGDLARVAAYRLHNRRSGYPPYDEHSRRRAIEDADVDCIELDPLLRNALEGHGFRVIHDDFMGFETQKRYKQMNKQEQAVVDSFQGEKAYEEVLAKAEYYLDQGKAQMPLLLGMGGTI